jgi:hypothetical protein
MESPWVIDHALSFCDTSSTPYRPTYREELLVPDDGLDGVHFWLKGTGSHQPSVGWMDNAIVQTFPPDGNLMYEELGTPHPLNTDVTRPPKAFYANAAGVGSENRYWAANRSQINPAGTHYMGFTLNLRGDNSGFAFGAVETVPLNIRVGSLRRIEIHILNGEIWTEINDEVGLTSNEGTHLAIPTGVDSVRVDAIWDVSDATGVRAWLRVGGVSTGGSLQTIRGPYGTNPQDLLRGLVITKHDVSVADMYYAVRNWGPITTVDDLSGPLNGARPAKYGAVLDRGYNRLSFLPILDGREAWDVITDVAAAEFGSVFWDEAGIFTYWNLVTMIGKRANAVRSFSLDDIAGLQITTSLDSVRNAWTVQTSKKTSARNTVYVSKSADEFYVPAGETREFRVYADNIQTMEPRYLSRYTTAPQPQAWPAWTDNSTHGYCLEYFSGGVWSEPLVLGTEPFINCWLDTDGYVVVHIWNWLSEDVRFTQAGNPALRIEGTLVNNYDDISTKFIDRASVSKYGGRVYEVSGEWYQEYYDAVGMADALLTRTAKPIPATDAIEVAGDPRVQLGDCVSVHDPDGMGETMRLQIYGITRTLSKDDGLRDTYTVEMVESSSAGIWDSPQYGLWDTTFIWSD